MPPAMAAPCWAVPDQTARAAARVAPGDQRRGLVHAGEHRVVLGAQPERPRVAQVGLLQAAGTKVLGPAGDRPYRRDIPGVVYKRQLRIGGPGRGGHGHAGSGPQPELVREPHRQLHPHRCQRMAGSEVIVSQPLVPGHMQAAGHLPPPFLTPRAARPNGPADRLLSTLADIAGLVQIPSPARCRGQ